MNRRAVIKALGSVGLLAGAGVIAKAWAGEELEAAIPQLLLPPEITSSLFHVVGTLPEPVEIKRIVATNPAAAVMVNSVAPKQLLGWPEALSDADTPWLSQWSQQLPVVTDSLSQLAELQPDIIIETAPATAEVLAKAKAVHEQTGIAYVVVDEGQLSDFPEQIRVLGAALGHQRHGQQLANAALDVMIGSSISETTAVSEVLPFADIAPVPVITQLMHALAQQGDWNGLRHLCILYFAAAPTEQQLQQLLG